MKWSAEQGATDSDQANPALRTHGLHMQVGVAEMHSVLQLDGLAVQAGVQQVLKLQGRSCNCWLVQVLQHQERVGRAELDHLGFVVLERHGILRQVAHIVNSGLGDAVVALVRELALLDVEVLVLGLLCGLGVFDFGVVLVEGPSLTFLLIILLGIFWCILLLVFRMSHFRDLCHLTQE